MPLDIVIGTQWGDEGKGRVVDLLASRAAVVARYNGGDNAGHTVTVGPQTFKLHIVPSGIIHSHTRAVIGQGTVVNPATLISEIEMLRSAGVEAGPDRLRLSHAAHLITPSHKALDQAQEARRGKGQIGTTGRGIGPAYTDKASRRGLRMEDMLEVEGFRQKLHAHVVENNRILTDLYHAVPLDPEGVVNEYLQYARILAPYIGDAGDWLVDAAGQDQSILAEGAQGTLLDLDLGTYPYVTSSYPTAPGALVGLGAGMLPIGRVIGVTKAFQTRVGAGPFPTELSDDEAIRLRGTGANPWDEFGTTTGRPRRVGWLDGVLLRYAARVNGLTELVVTKLDVLSGFDRLEVCTAYCRDDREYERLPLGPGDLEPFAPVYESVPGWQADLTAARRWSDLPAEAQQYIRKIEAVGGVPVSLVSVGPERDQIVEVER